MPSAMAIKMNAGYAKIGCNCKYCRISFNNLQERDTHFRFNHRPCLNAQRFNIVPKYIFTCLSCDETFNAEGDLVIHQRIHDGESPFKCDLCEMKFKSKGEFVSHEIHHMAEKKDAPVKSPKSRKDMIKCAFCKKLFHKNKRKDLTVHVMNTHSDKLWKETKSKKYDCNECNEVYHKKGDLKLHMKTHLKDRKNLPKINYPNRICKNCGEKISSNHKCSFENNLFCKPCDKAFSNKAALVLHRRMHLKRPFTCVKCKHSFSQEALMKKHICSSVLTEIATDMGKDSAELQNCQTTSDDDHLLIIEEDIHDNTSEEDVDDPLSISDDTVNKGEANVLNILVIDEEIQDSTNRKNVSNKSHILLKDITTLTKSEKNNDHSSRPQDNIVSGCDSKMELNRLISDEENIVEKQNMEDKKKSNDDPLNKLNFNTLNNTAEETIDDPLEISDIEMDDFVNNTTDDEIIVSLESSEGTKSFDYLNGIKEFQSSFGNINHEHKEVIKDTMFSNCLDNENYDSIYKGFVVLETPVFFDTSDLVYTS